MSEIASLAINVDTTSSVKSLQDLKVASVEAQHGVDSMQAAIARQERVSAGVAASMSKTSVAVTETSKSYLKLDNDVSKYLASQDKTLKAVQDLTKAETLLANALGQGVISQQQHNDALRAAEGAYAKAANSAKSHAGAMTELGLNTSFARREMTLITKDIVTGDFSRAGRSFGTLVGHSNLLQAALSPIGLAVIGITAAFGGLVYASVKTQQLEQGMNSLLAQVIATGRGAEFTKQKLYDMVQNADRISGVTGDGAEKIVSSFLKVKTLGSDAIDQLTGLVADFAKALGTDAVKAAENLAEAMRNPYEGAKKLDDQLGFLTSSQYLTVESMHKMGDEAGIQKLIIEALDARIKNLHENTLTGWQRSMEAITKEWDGVKKTLTDEGFWDKLGKKFETISVFWLRFTRDIIAAPRRIATMISGGNPDAPTSSPANGAANRKSPNEDNRQVMKGVDDELKAQFKLTETYRNQTDAMDQLRNRKKALTEAYNAAQALGGATTQDSEAYSKSIKGLDAAMAKLQPKVKDNTQEYMRFIDAINLRAQEMLTENEAGIKLTQTEKTLLAVRGGLYNEKFNQSQRDAIIDALTRADAIEKEGIATQGLIKRLAEKRKWEEEEAVIQQGISDGAERNTQKLIADLAALGGQKDLRIELVALAQRQQAIDLSNGNAETIAKVNEQFERQIQLIDKINQVSSDNKLLTVAEKLLSTFGKVGQSLSQMIKAYGEYGKQQIQVQKELEAQRAIAEKTNDPERAIKAQDKAQQEMSKNALGLYGDMAGAAAGFFEQGSRGYKALSIASQVFHAAELAMTIAELVPKAISAVLTQGEGEPYTAFFRIAAMTAIVAGLGVAVGGAGGGGGGPPSAAQRQASQGTGSILGDSSLKSSSIENALKGLNDRSLIGNENTAAMRRLLTSIDRGISNFANLVVRSAGFEQNGAAAVSSVGRITPQGPIGGQILNSIGLGFLTGGPIGNLINSLTRVSNTITDQGLRIANQTLGDARQNFRAEGYTDVSQRSSFLGIRTGSSNRTVTNQLSGDITSQFSLVVENLFQTILASARIFGSNIKGVTDLLNGFNIAGLNLSLKDLKGDALVKAISEVFSKLGDDLAKAAFPELAKFQKAGEGMLETLGRLAQEFAATNYVIELMGKDVGTAFGAVGTASIEARDDLVQLFGGLQQISEAVTQYVDGFYTDGEKAVIAARGLAVTFKDIGVAIPDSIDAYRALVDQQDLSTASGRQMFQMLISASDAFRKATLEIDKLKQSLKDVQSTTYDFRVANAGRINAVGGNVNIGTIAQQRGAELLSGNSTGTPQQRIDNINRYVGVIDTWVSSEVAGIKARQAAAQAAAQAQSQLQQQITQMQIASLQKQLDLSKAWVSVMDSAKKAIDALRLTSASPATLLGRLNSSGDDVTALLAQYRSASGQNKIDTANKLLGAVNTRQGLGQEAYQRPGADYQKLYNDNIAIYTEIQNDAKDASQQQEELQNRIAGLQQLSASYNAQTAGNTAQTNSEIDAVNAQARELYEAAGAQYELAAAAQVDTLNLQLEELRGIRSAIDKLPSKQDVIPEQMREVVSLSPITVNVGGNNVDNLVLRSVTRNGRVIRQIVEQS